MKPENRGGRGVDHWPGHWSEWRHQPGQNQCHFIKNLNTQQATIKECFYKHKGTSSLAETAQSHQKYPHDNCVAI